MSSSNKVIKRVMVVLMLIVIFLSEYDNNNLMSEKLNIDYPKHDVNGYIAWGAGGGTDNFSRALTPMAEKHLGKTIVLQNKPGATGAVALQFVLNQKSDGYSLLYSAENPPIYGVMEISDYSYDEFYPVILMARETSVIVVRNDSKYKSIEELFRDAKANPGKVSLGTTGTGGLPFVVASMIKATNDIDFNQVPFDGDGPVLTALLGGHVDVTVTNLSAAIELHKAGRIRILTSMSNEPIKDYPDIPAISEIFPEYEKYLPWGAFYGVFIKKDTPDIIKEILTDAFQKGFDEPRFQEFLENAHVVPLGISGKEADKFIKEWQMKTAWLLYDAGGTDISPATFGIERID